MAPFWVIPGTFLSGAPAAGGIAAISAIGVIGGFVTPWAIGFIRDRTGDFRGGEIGVACLALLVSVMFYVVSGRQEAAPGAVRP